MSELHNGETVEHNSEAQLRVVFEAAMDGMFVIDMQGRYTDVNPAGCRMFGYTRAEILGADIRLLLFPEDIREDTFTSRRALWQDGGFVSERRLRCKDGSEVWVEMTVTPFAVAGETLALGVMRDITARREATRILVEKEAQLRQIIDLVPQAISIKNREGRFLLVNRAAAENYHTTVEALTGALQMDYYPCQEQVRRFLAEDAQIIESGQPLYIAEEAVRYSGGETRFQQVAKMPFRLAGQDETLVLSVITDITERKRVENALFRLLELSRALMAIRHPDGILAHAIKSAVDIIEVADRGSVQLLMDDGKTMKTVAVSGGGLESRTTTFRPGVGIAGHVLVTGEVINVPDVQKDERFVPGSYPLRFRSLLVAPLMTEDRMLGTLSLSSAKAGVFAATDEALIQLIADQVAAVLENVRLLDEWRRSEQRVRDFLDNVDDMVYFQALDGSLSMLNTACTRIAGYSPEEFDANPQIWREILDPESLEIVERFFAEHPEGIASFEVNYRLRCKDGAWRWIQSRMTGVKDASGRYIGYNCVDRDITDHKRAEDALHQRQRELESLLETNRDLSGTLDLGELLELIARRAVALLDADECMLFRLDADGVTLRPALALGEHAKQATGCTVKVSEGLVGLCLRERRPILANDAERDPHFFQPPDLPRLPHEHLMVTPLLSGEQPTGAMLVSRIKKQPFAEDQLTIFAGFAQQAAIAIENARLFEQAQQRAARLAIFNEIGRAVSSLLDRESVLEVIYTELQRVLPLDAFYVCLYEAETGMLSYPLVYDAGERYDQGPIPLDSGTALGQTIRSAEPHLVNRRVEETQSMPLYPVGNSTRRAISLMFAPLQIGERVIGAISAQSYRPDVVYNQEHLDLLTGVANQAAIAIENAELFDQAKEALVEATMLTAVMNATTDMVGVVDEFGKILYINPAGLHMVGYTEDEVASLSFMSFHPPEGVKFLLEDVPLVIEKTGVWSGETVLRHRSGALIPASQVIVVMRDEQGAPYAVGTIIRDVSEQRAAEVERERLLASVQQQAAQLAMLNEIGRAASSVRDHERLFELLYEQLKRVLPLDVFEVDLYDPESGRVSYPLIYDGGCRYEESPMLLSPARVIAGPLLTGEPVLINRTPEELQRPPRCPIGDANKTSASLLFAPLKIGERVIGLLGVHSYQLNVYDQEHLDLLVGVASQIANAVENANLFEQVQRRAAQLALLNEIGRELASLLDRESILEAIYRQLRRALPLDTFFVCLYDAASGMVMFPLLYDEDRRYDETPRPLPADTAIAEVITTGRPSLTNRSPQEREQVKLKQALGSGRSSASLIYVPIQLGERVVGALSVQSYRFNAYTKEHVDLVVGVATQAAIALENARLYAEVQQHVEMLDRRVEARTAELREALIRAQKSERAKSEFVSTVNHELRTPLANLKLYLDLLRKGRPERQAYYMETLEREIERLSTLVEDILAIARLDDDAPLQWKKIDLVALAYEAAQRFFPLAESRKLDFSYAVPETVVVVNADAGQVMRVFVNLLGNALTYTPSGGSVTLYVRTRQANDGRWAVISVQDNGPGIAPEEQAMIFERFYRGNAGRDSGLPGSGLGLAIVREIVQLHNGRVELESAPGKGSVFKVWLPLA
ncbi:MAG: GAF domain-containing protein [Anaerolineae bacterium]|nr:GAF domain-containing protein [Anaerolineae bacterium]